MRTIKVIDVTLRDGGCVNDFNFGEMDMNRILTGLNQSGVDYIELGYIDEKKGTDSGRTQFKNEHVISQNFLKSKSDNSAYVVMMDYGTFDVSQLSPRTKDSIDGIRLAFHKKDVAKIVDACRSIKGKGYDFYIQPMLTLRYTDAELLSLIEMVNTELPDASAFYIVDSFGEMRHNDVIRALNLVDHNLQKHIPVGFHSHNNLQMSYANAISVLQFPTTRDLFIDSSIMGMGKGAGNLNTELLLEHLNLYYGGQYQISALLNVIDTVLNRIKVDYPWGYSAEYYLSAINRCSPSYAKHFQMKHMLPVDQISELLGMIAEEKKISFDMEYADKIFFDYISQEVDDSDAIKALAELFSGREILLLAPGRSSETEADKIIKYAKDNDSIIVSINTMYDKIESDYIFLSNRRRFKSLCENAELSNLPDLICTSNIQVADNQKAYIISYSDYVCTNPAITNNAGMMALNLLNRLHVKDVILAGFDGFGLDSHREGAYSDPISRAEIKALNSAISEHIHAVADRINIKFLTESIYE